MSMLSLLTLGAALAAGSEEQEVGGARVYGGARVGLAVPTGYKGMATSYGVEMGALAKSGNQLGLRFIWTPNPPDVYGDNTPDQAFGPVLAWSYNIRVAPRFELGPAIALGASFGQAPEGSPQDGENKILPAISAGIGARGLIPMGGGSALAIGPEIGFIPTILAPLIALNITVIGPKPKATDGDI